MFPPPQRFKVGVRSEEGKGVILFWKRLFAGTVPANKNLFAGTVPANKNLFTGTIPANKNLFAGTCSGK